MKELHINVTPEWAKQAAAREPESGIVSAGGGSLRDPQDWGEPEVSGNDVVDEMQKPTHSEPSAVDALRLLMNEVQAVVDMDAVGLPLSRAVCAAQDVLDRHAAPMPDDYIDRIIRAVAELPDRTSPDNWPEAMLVTADELRGIIAEENRRPSTAKYTAFRPECSRCKCPMNFVDGGAPEHDVKEPHWRCEMWVGGGVCGRTMSEAAAKAMARQTL